MEERARKTLKPQEFTSIDDFLPFVPLSLRVLSLLRNASGGEREARAAGGGRRAAGG